MNISKINARIDFKFDRNEKSSKLPFRKTLLDNVSCILFLQSSWKTFPGQESPFSARVGVVGKRIVEMSGIKSPFCVHGYQPGIPTPPSPSRAEKGGEQKTLRFTEMNYLGSSPYEFLFIHVCLFSEIKKYAMVIWIHKYIQKKTIDTIYRVGHKKLRVFEHV